METTIVKGLGFRGPIYNIVLGLGFWGLKSLLLKLYTAFKIWIPFLQCGFWSTV